METDTHTPEEGDHVTHGEPVVSADDLEQTIAHLTVDPKEDIGTFGKDDETTRLIREHLHRSRTLASATAEALEDTSDDDSGDKKVDPQTDWRLDEQTREIGLNGIADARKRLHRTTSGEGTQE